MTIAKFEPVIEKVRADVAMSAAPLQTTVGDVVELTGNGLHSGAVTRVVVKPADVDAGIVFADNGSRIRGLASNVVDTARGTSIGVNGNRIKTIEHLMAALRGTGIDNAVVEVQGSEMPALDGSALPFAAALQSVGIVKQDAPKKFAMLTEPVYVQRGDSFILAIPAPRLSITYVMNYDHPLIGSQTVTYCPDEHDFLSEIAPARTFVLYEEVAALLESGLSQGGSVDNVVVLWRDRTSSELRFPNELAKHKILDLIGDMSLIGQPLLAEIVAVKSGHTLNVEFAGKVENYLLALRQG